MSSTALGKLIALYIVFGLITYGFIQRERAAGEAPGPHDKLKSLFWGMIWPFYWLAVVGPKSALNTFVKFFSHNIGFWVVYLLGIPASFAVFLYVRWDDGLLFAQGAWLIFKSLCMALVWPVFLFV